MAVFQDAQHTTVQPRQQTHNERRQRFMGRILVLPAALWLTIFFALPLLVVLIFSVMTPDPVRQVRFPLTINQYQRILQPAYTSTLARSINTAVVTTAVCLVVGYPLAFFIATRPKRQRNFFLLLVVIPFWTNFLVRTYAWLFIMNDNGLVNSLLVNMLGVLDAPIGMVNTPFAVIVGLVYGYLPYMVLPIYSTIEKFNFRYVEAVHDLGGNDWQAFWRVVLPITMPGVIAGCVLVFIPAIGAFVTPDLLGGARALMIGNQINDAVVSPTGKPFGSALSLTLMALVMVALLIISRFGRERSTGQVIR
jgi:spermidine/putrescine transport system permease protein